MNRSSHRLVVLTFFLGILFLSGCELDGYPEDLRYNPRTDPLVDRSKTPKTDAPYYDLPGEFPQVIFPYLPEAERSEILLDPAKMSADKRQELNKILIDLFGTPAHPTVGIGTGSFRQELHLDDATLAHGSQIYRQQCLHCHGLDGDGRGATAPWVNPHPRDYRQGVFKFTSSSQSEGQRKPRRDDLLRTLQEGIEGTSMPAFRLLSDADLDALVSYVIHLSLRGETEYQVMKSFIKGESEAEDTVESRVKDYSEQLVQFWQQAQTSLIPAGPYPDFKNDEEREKYVRESVLRGYGLFSRPKPEGALKSAGCLGCHTDYGRQSAFKYDYWGTIVRPTDLTTGLYRGGRRPIDLFWRIHSGVNGVTMPASSANLSPEEIWDVVNFLQILPYPKMREKYGIRLEGAQ